MISRIVQKQAKTALAIGLFFTVGQMAMGSDTPAHIDGPPPPVLPEMVARDNQGRVTMRAMRLDSPLVVDGKLEEAVYQTVPSVSGFFQQEPQEGEPATEKTEVWVLFDDKNIYISGRCWDSHPERMVANEMRRDSRGLSQNENFAVILDTFYDRRNAFYFHTNPLGGLYDALVTDERDVNRDWNTVWYVETARVKNGWTVEMSIPFKSLRYKKGGAQIWGINFRRIVRWKNEFSHLTSIPASYGFRGITKVSSAATLVGLETPARSKNLEIKPYAISGITTEKSVEPPVSNDFDGNAGFDLKYGVTKGLIFDFTYNTDFAQVEVDEEQVNLTRFSLFFPEKREFFLEGQGVFQFGARGGGRSGRSNTPIMFFSRRIGLNEGQAVPIIAGGRLTGRAGKYSIGAISIVTDEHEASGALTTNFSVLRLKRDILRRSSIGVIGTLRSTSLGGEGDNRVLGADANLAFYDNLRINSYWARSQTPGLEGGGTSYQARLDYAADRYGLQIERLVAGEHFNPEIGFMRRKDFQRNFVQTRFSPRPSSIEAIRKLGWEASLDYITDNEGRLETRRARMSFGIEFENSDELTAAYTRTFEFLPEPFEIARDVVLPVGGYRFHDMWVRYELGPQRKVSGGFSLRTGSFYSGKRTGVSYQGRAEITPQISVEPRISWDWIKLAEGEVVTRLLSTRFSYTLTPRTYVSALVQYNSTVDSFSTNVRFRWEYEPGSDLFVVYSEDRDTLLAGFGGLRNRSLAIKFTRLFRF